MMPPNGSGESLTLQKKRGKFNCDFFHKDSGKIDFAEI
jgi:hypothetical protein